MPDMYTRMIEIQNFDPESQLFFYISFVVLFLLISLWLLYVFSISQS